MHTEVEILFFMSKLPSASILLQAGKSYLRQAEVIRTTDSPNDAVEAFVDAANSFRKTDAGMAAKCYLSAIDIYKEMVLFIFSILQINGLH